MGWTVKKRKPAGKAGAWIAAAIFVVFGGFIAAGQGAIPGIPKGTSDRPTLIAKCCFNKDYTIITIGAWSDPRVEQQVDLLDDAFPPLHQRSTMIAVVRGNGSAKGQLSVGKGIRAVFRAGNRTRFGGRGKAKWSIHEVKQLRRIYGLADDEYATLIVTRYGKVVMHFGEPVDEATILAVLDDARASKAKTG